MESFIQYAFILLLALFHNSVKASPFPTLQPGHNDGVFPSLGNGSVDNATSVIVRNITPWLHCRDEVNAHDCHKQHTTNCSPDWEVRSRSSICIANCRCVNEDMALLIARNMSVRNLPIRLAAKPDEFSAAREVDDMMAFLQKRYSETVAHHSVFEHQVLPHNATVQVDKTDLNSTCAITCNSHEMLANCTRSHATAQCTNNCTLVVDGTLSTNSTLRDLCKATCSCTAETSGLDKGPAETDDDNLATPQPSQYYEHAIPETFMRLGMEIHRPLLEASLGSTMIPVNQELVAADGSFYRPPTSLDKIPEYSSGLETTANKHQNDESSKALGLPLLGAHSSLLQPGQVKHEYTPETVPADEDTDGEVPVTEPPNLDPEPSDARDKSLPAA